MGGEFGQWNEWNCKKEIDWTLLNYPNHDALKTMIKELNHLYLKTPELWEYDFDAKGFEWVDFGDKENSMIIYKRKSSDREVLCVHNFTENCYRDYLLSLKNVKTLREIFNSDAKKYGGDTQEKVLGLFLTAISGKGGLFQLSIAPLATQIFEVHYE
jgi:1,4-alpha-glucan branching enzyme